MRKTKATFVVNSPNPDYSQQFLDIFGRFEAVEALYSPSEEGIRTIHHHNKSVVMAIPFQIPENLEDKTITVNVFFNDSDKFSDHYENPIFLENGIQEVIKEIMDVATKYNIDVGDYIPDNLTVPQPSMHDCLLCKIYREGTRPNEDSTTIPLMNVIMYETENFYVVPAKGALVEGYVMLVPKHHVWSFASLSLKELEEASHIVRKLEEILGKIFGNSFVCFEHGSGTEGKCKHEKAIVHAHLHIVPISMHMSDEVAAELHIQQLSSLSELSKFSTSPYLLYWDSLTAGLGISSDPALYVPRQCVRQMIGDQIGLEGSLWNWRNHAFMGKIESTVFKFYLYLQDNFLSLDPETIACTKGFMEEMAARNKRF